MWVVSQRKLKDFWKIHPDAEMPLSVWYQFAKSAEWKSLQDIVADCPSTDQVGSCFVFDIGGNKYRLIATLSKGRKKIYIREILTHKEYDRDKWKKYCQTDA